MPTRIVHNSPPLCAFLEPLIESLSQPQRQHLRDLCDALLVCESEKTISALQRQFVETTDESNWSDFLRISPWSAPGVRAGLRASQIKWALDEAEKSGQAKEIYLNLDDSLGEKDKATWRLEPVDWHHDHTERTPGQPRHKNSFCYLACTMKIGEIVVTLDLQLYLRARTIRALNRQREGEGRLRFRSKNTIARQMLQQIAPLLEPDWAVVVQFDSWYASNKLLKFVHRQKWQLTCVLRSNRKLNGMRLDQHNQQMRHKWHTRISVTNAEGKQNRYYVRQLEGRLSELAIDLRVLISKRHLGQQTSAYFASTRSDCKPQATLQGYAGRWSCEVVNFYLKTQLGLEDFRVRCYEAVDRYLVAVHLAWAYVERRFIDERSPQIKTYGDLIRRHREEHAEAWLKAAVEMALEGASLDQVLQRFLRREPEAK
jgi:DDE superfamily endonuclease